MASTIHQAIVIATKTTPMDGRQRPLGEVKAGGVTLLKRALLTLAGKGVNRFSIVVADESVRDRVADDPKLTGLELQWVLNDTRASEDGFSVLQAAEGVVGDFLVVPADRVFSPDIAAQLTERRRDGVTLAVAAHTTDAIDASDPPLTLPNGETFVGLLTADQSLLDALAAREASGGPVMLHTVLSDFVAADRLATVDIGSEYCLAVTDKASRAKADSVLLKALGKSVDGLVARHVNRVFSLAVTRVLRNTWVRPNHVTGVSLGAAAVGAVAAAQATVAEPWWLIVGALFWQLASMLDGVDGELARLKFMGSKFGEWFDTLSDDIGRLLVFTGSGIGAAAVFGSQLWLVLTALTVTIQIGTSVPVYRKLLQSGSGSHYALAWEGDSKTTLWTRFKASLGFFSRRDSYIAIWLGFALVGQLKIAIVLNFIVTMFVLANELLSPRQARAGFVQQRAAKAVPANARPANTQPARSSLAA